MAGLLYLMAGRSPRGKVETCKVFQKLDLRLTSYGFNLYTIDRKRKRKKRLNTKSRNEIVFLCMIEHSTSVDAEKEEGQKERVQSFNLL